MIDSEAYQTLKRGVVIPASPLALDAGRRLDERRQRALWRYYVAAGAGGIAIGVHTTQFAIRDPKVGLFRPLLELGADEMERLEAAESPSPQPSPARGEGEERSHPNPLPAGEGVSAPSRPTSASPLRSAVEATAGSRLVRIGGVCGRTAQAVSEAEILRELGYHAGMLSLAAMKDADDAALVDHCRAVAEVIPLVGFYLQPAVGGRVLGYEFWRRFAEIENVVAVKIAPFNRYWTIDVIRALAEAGRDDIAIYTGNDDNIVMDLLTPYRFTVDGKLVERRIVGGLLGHWSVWTKKAVELLDECHAVVESRSDVPMEMLRRSIEVTDTNAAFFDTANGFAGCIAGIHEVLRRQGLLEGIWCLDPEERLSPGQAEEIDRVYLAYPHLNDDAFVAAHRDEWLSG
jgi:hypothetical protein